LLETFYKSILMPAMSRSLLLFITLITAGGLPAQTTLVAPGSVWKYLDNGSNQGTAWRAPAFDDSGWASGAAQLGYGDGDEATVVSFGPSSTAKYITTYFRKSFAVVSPGSFAGYTLRVKRDDGIVVYLNGTEVFRDTMPAGTPGYTTLATAAVGDDGATWLTASVPAGAFVAGTNVLAVEIHQSSATSSDISFDLELTGSTTATVTRGPYLQIGTPTGVTVRWRTDAATNSRVSYGLTAGSLTSTVDDAAATTEHVVTLSGLSPNTRYYYSVGSTAGVLAGGDANTYFVTSPASGSQRPTRVWVIGDAGTGDTNQARVRDAYYTFTGTTHTDLWLQLGDNAYDTGTDAEYQAKMFNVYAALLRKSVTWPTLGNHETAQSTNPADTIAYFQSFSFPTAGQAGGVASGTKKYYSFDFGNIHFVCLDSMASSRAPGSAMLTWLEADLAANTKDWLVAYFHHPPYTKGSHNSDTETELIEMRQNVLPILENHGVDLVLTGHSHSYERSYFIDGHYGLSTTFTNAMKKNSGGGVEGSATGAYTKTLLGPSAHQGAVYAVAGSSGKISGGTLNHPAMYVSLNTLGSMVLDVNGGRMDVKFLSDLGAVADSFTMLKGVANAAPTVALTSPANGAVYAGPASIALAATATDVDGTVARVDFYNGTALLFSDTAAPFAYSWTGVGAGTYTLTARAVDNLGAVTASAAATVTVTAGDTVLVAKGTTWKYLDTGVDQGTAWRAVAFVDTTWKSGAAQLGYGDGDEATVVSYGPQASRKYITTYFRKSFTVTDPAAFQTLVLNLLRDDGAVVYLNGVEVFRSNMPTGTVSFSTTASSDVTGAAESTQYFPASFAAAGKLTAGTNVVAVEVHQRSRNSSDLSFDLEVLGRR
jgi:acid phosphatase type 7